MSSRQKHSVMHVHGIGVNATRTDMVAGANGEFSIVMDEPVERHGNNEGMLPLDAFLCGFAACTNVIINMIAKELGITLSNIKLNVTGHLDPRGYMGMKQIDVPFAKIELDISGNVSGNLMKLDILKSQLRWRCPAAATFYATGTDVVENWNLLES